jgi:hypothetical protein
MNEQDDAWDRDHAHELLTDAGIPRVDPDGQPIGLAVRVGLLIDEEQQCARRTRRAAKEPRAMSTKRPLGWRITSTYCPACAPDGIRDCYAPMREGDDHGVPYSCDICDELLLPCEHEWGEWGPWFQGGEWRSCTRANCHEAEHRETIAP